MVIRYQPNRNKWVVYTTLRQVDGVIHNKTNQSFERGKEIIRWQKLWYKQELSSKNGFLKHNCKEKITTFGCVPGSEIDYIVVRCSKGSITNLHLNNKAHWWNELSLSEEVRQQIYFQCQEAVQSLDLRYAGVDVLIEKEGRIFLI